MTDSGTPGGMDETPHVTDFSDKPTDHPAPRTALAWSEE